MAILANEKTRIIIQGITGREATIFARDSVDYGAKIVAGVVPGKGGWNVHGIPVYDCIKSALAEHDAEASVISVPPATVKDAAFEAIDNGLKLVLIVTERVPRKDVVEILALAQIKGARVIGPNSLGIISPHKTKLGMIGGRPKDILKAYSKGNTGIISRSGGMTTEIANLLTCNEIGQSTCISIGGDPIVGSTYADLIPLYERDPQTDIVVIFCEPGGSMEEELAECVVKNRISLPIVAFVAGRFVDEMPGIRFGHAGVIVEGRSGSTRNKIKLFKRAGIIIAEEFSEIVEIVKSKKGCIFSS